MEEYLQETEYCDFESREIKKLVDDLSISEKSNIEIAKILFYWVRDRIAYRLGIWNRRASETLAMLGLLLPVSLPQNLLY